MNRFQEAIYKGRLWGVIGHDIKQRDSWKKNCRGTNKGGRDALGGAKELAGSKRRVRNVSHGGENRRGSCGKERIHLPIWWGVQLKDSRGQVCCVGT